MNEILPMYLSMGVSEEKFMDSTPKELEPYKKAYELKQKSKDFDMWQMGIYITNAVQTAVQNSLYGKKSKSKYMEKPLLEDILEQKEEKINNENAEDAKKFARWAIAFNLRNKQQ